MEITSRTEDGVVLVDVAGNVSGSTDEESELITMMSDFSSRGNNLFVANFDNIVSFDESGMRMLLRVCTTVHRNGGHMVFVRSIAEGTIDGDSLPDEDKLVFESERRAIEVLKRRGTAE
jgi:anti-anti-sigma factor